MTGSAFSAGRFNKIGQGGTACRGGAGGEGKKFPSDLRLADDGKRHSDLDRARDVVVEGGSAG